MNVNHMILFLWYGWLSNCEYKWYAWTIQTFGTGNVFWIFSWLTVWQKSDLLVKLFHWQQPCWSDGSRKWLTKQIGKYHSRKCRDDFPSGGIEHVTKRTALWRMLICNDSESWQIDCLELNLRPDSVMQSALIDGYCKEGSTMAAFCFCEWIPGWLAQT